MTVMGWIFALALAAAAGRLILWTSLARGSDHASTLEAVRDWSGTVAEYCVAPLGVACRGHVVVRHARERDLGQGLLRRLRGLEPRDAVELLRAEGLRAELMPGVDADVLVGRPLEPALARARRSTSR